MIIVEWSLPLALLLLKLLVAVWSQSAPAKDTPCPAANCSSPAETDHLCKRQVFRAVYRYIPVQHKCWQAVPTPCSPEIQVNRSKTDTYQSDLVEEENKDNTTETLEDDCVGCTRPCYVYRQGICIRFQLKCIVENAVEYHCCPGYEEVNNKCVLVKACFENNGNCQQLCHQKKDGTNYCGCFPGYHLKNKTHCEETDECLSQNGNCSHKCNNVMGTYYCSCEEGFVLKDIQTCEEVNECSIGNGGCEHECVNTVGDYYCLCKPGYRLEKGYRCIDWDECNWLNGGCSHYCLNYDGGYFCLCPPELRLGKDNRTCISPSTSTISSSTFSTSTISLTQFKKPSTRFREPLDPNWVEPTPRFIPGREAPVQAEPKPAMGLEVIVGPLVALAVLCAICVTAAWFIRSKRKSREEQNRGVMIGPVMGASNGNRMHVFQVFSSEPYNREPSQQI